MNRISIITPSFRQVGQLSRCAASVADQQGDFKLEHLIEDGASGPEFDEWAASQSFALCNSEPDGGMYEAINRGFRKATGNIVAWLNSDEQYLPGALEKVSGFFDSHPEIDIIFGDLVLTDENGTALAYRQAIVPRIEHIRRCHLSTFSAATFVRSRCLEEGLLLDERWKVIADAVWVESLLAKGYKASALNEPLASFSMLGSNLGQSPKLYEERIKWEKETGVTNCHLRRIEQIRHRFRKLFGGAYLSRRVDVPLYRDGNPQRVPQRATLGGRWSPARDGADSGKVHRDGELSNFHPAKEPSNGLLSIIALGAAALVISIELGTKGVVMGPFLLATTLLLVSFRCHPRQIVIMTLFFGLIVTWSLANMPYYTFEGFIIRLLTFAVTSTIAVLWTNSRWNSGEWICSTIGFIRHLPEPLMLLDSRGRIIMVNSSCQSKLHMKAEIFLGKPINLYLPGEIPGFDTWGLRPPAGKFPLFTGGDDSQALLAQVFVVGRGIRKIFGISLSRGWQSGASSGIPDIPGSPEDADCHPAQTPFTAAILNAYDHRNFGDRAIIEAQTAWLETKISNVRTIVFSGYWEENGKVLGSSRSYPMPVTQHGKWGVLAPVVGGVLAVFGARVDTPWLAFKSADAYFLCGGGYLYSSASKMGSRQLWIHLANSLLALRMGKPVMQFPQSWGPFTKRIDAWLARKVAQKLPSISCRGAESLKLMKEWGVASKSLHIPDIVLALGKLRPDLVKQRPHGDGRLGIAPVDFQFAIQTNEATVASYVENLAEIAAAYQLATDRGVTIFTQVSVEGSDDDHWVAERLHSELLKRGVDSVLLGKRPWEEYWELISAPSVFVGCRMHSCIFALISGVPTIALSYQPKFQSLFEDLDMAERCFGITSFDPGSVAGLAASISNDQERERIVAAVDIMASKVFDELDTSWKACSEESIRKEIPHAQPSKERST